MSSDLRRWINVLYESAMPTVLYHHAPRSHRESIRSEGLLRRKSQAHQDAMSVGFGEHEGPFGGIFFAAKAIDETKWGIDTWQVDVRGLSLQPDDTTDPGDAEDTWWVTYDEDVAPERLKLLYAKPEPVSEGSAPTGGAAPKEEDIDIWKSGYCHALAIALHELSGYPIVALQIRRGRSNFIAHIMIEVHDNEYLDAEGIRGIDEILYETEFDDYTDSYTIREITPDDIKRSRRLVRITPEIALQAKALARRLLAGKGLTEGQAPRTGGAARLPEWLIKAPRVDVFARSPDAEFILDSSEGSWEWRECEVPVSAFKPTSAVIDTREEEAKRFHNIRQWMKQRGGAARAIQESPILALWWRGLFLLDGWHRMELAQKEGMSVFPTLVGLVPNARAARSANIG